MPVKYKPKSRANGLSSVNVTGNNTSGVSRPQDKNKESTSKKTLQQYTRGLHRRQVAEGYVLKIFFNCCNGQMAPLMVRKAAWRK
jgi:hypothetical protein